MKTVMGYNWDGLLGCKIMGELGERTHAALHRWASGKGVRNVTLARPVAAGRRRSPPVAKGVRFRRRAKNTGEASINRHVFATHIGNWKAAGMEIQFESRKPATRVMQLGLLNFSYQ